jgi:hypothetical protein
VKPALGHGGQIDLQLATGHHITVTHRPDQGDYRVTVMLMSRHAEAPRHFADQWTARAHAEHLVKAYRSHRNEPFTYTVKSIIAAGKS